MLVRADGVQIPQAAHAWLAARFAAAGRPRAAEIAPLWDELVLATAIHDWGWLPYDATAEREPFFQTPPSTSIGLWREATARAEVVGALPGLLVSLHAGRIFGFARAAPAAQEAGVEAFLLEEAERQTRLRERTGLRGETVTLLHDALWAFDRLSLTACHGADGPSTLTGAPWTDGFRTLEITPDGYPGGLLTLDPWPFAGEALSLTVAARDGAELPVELRAP